jgi:hypothetical protein
LGELHHHRANGVNTVYSVAVIFIICHSELVATQPLGHQIVAIESAIM